MNIIKRTVILLISFFLSGLVIGIILNYFIHSELKFDNFIILSVLIPIIYLIIFIIFIKMFFLKNLRKLKNEIYSLYNNPLHEIKYLEYPVCFNEITKALFDYNCKAKEIFKSIIDFETFIENIKIKIDELFDKYITAVKRVSTMTDILKNSDLSITTRLNKDEIQLNKNLERMEILKRDFSNLIKYSLDMNRNSVEIKSKFEKLDKIKELFKINHNIIKNRFEVEKENILKISKNIETLDNIMQHLDILTVNIGVEVSKLEGGSSEVKVLSEEVKRNIQELYKSLGIIRSVTENIKDNYTDKLNDCSKVQELINNNFDIFDNMKKSIENIDNKNENLLNELKQNTDNMDILLLNTISIVNEEEYLKGELNSYLEKFNDFMIENNNATAVSEEYHKLFNRFVNETKKITVLLSTYDHLKEINIGLNKELENVINKLNLLVEKSK